MSGADHDPPEIDALLEQFSGAVAYDVGGNVGRAAEIFARRFERVVTFEPAAESFEELEELAARTDNVSAVMAALSNVTGQIELAEQEHPMKSGQLTSAGVVANTWEGWGRIEALRAVPAFRLDDVTATYGVPDLVKIDVEGHEVKVVEGAMRTIQEVAPFLHLEVHSGELGAELRKLLEPVYGDGLVRHQHPGYHPREWGYLNHYWLVVA